jgi:hypothetical protein
MNDPAPYRQRGGCARTFLIILLALSTGALGSYEYWRLHQGVPPDPVEVIVTEMKTHAVIEHERQVAVWYRACPAVWGKSPEIFMAWPAVLTYQIELGDIQVSRSGSIINVRTSAIHSLDPSVPTDRMDYTGAVSIFSLAVDKEELINLEIAKATPVARYLTTYFLAHDPSLVQDFKEEVQSLVEHFTASLGVPVSQVNVEIPKVEVATWPQLPRIELCTGTRAAMNGIPFAKFETNATIPIGFRIPPRHSSGADSAPPASASRSSAASPPSSSAAPGGSSAPR